MKLTKLTAEQASRLPAIRDEWLSIGLSTAPADRRRAESGVAKAYSTAGLPPPKIIIWLDSPMQGAMGATLLAGSKFGDQVWAQVRAQVLDQAGAQVLDQVWAQVGDQVRDQFLDQVWDQVGDQARGQVRAQVLDQVWDQVWDQIGDQIRDQIGDQIRDQIGDQVGGQAWAQVGDQAYRAGYGAHDANWIGFYAAMREFGVDTSKLDGLTEIAHSCGWWWPFAGACILTERPCAIRRDENNRLHSETSAAIEYRDGWGVCAWHATRIPEEWIKNRACLTPKKAMAVTNLEQRRAAIGLLGWDNILAALKFKTIDADPDPQIGTLIEVKLSDLRAPARFLRVKCGTGRSFSMGVPPTAKTAIEAQAWCMGKKPAEFLPPEIRT